MERVPRGLRLGASLAWLAWIAANAAAIAAPGDPYPSTPFPRVDSGLHADFIKKLATNASGRLLLTASDDKTARVWDVASGRLLQVLRVPIVDGYEGQLYSAALAPDSGTAVVGGFLGSAEGGSSAIYFFNTATGGMTLRLRNGSAVATENLAYSPDGRVLAVCLADGRGIMLFDMSKRTLLRRDEQPSDKIHGASFAANGDFAITTYDGFIRIYRARDNYTSVLVERLQRAQRPMHVQFSPDARELVVGFEDAPVFSILDAATASELHSSTLPEQTKQQGLPVVEWSSDGQSVYAGGEMTDALEAPLYRFADKGRGQPQKVLTSTRRISDLRRLPGGAMAFASGEPELGVFEASGRVRWRLRSDAIDPRRDPSRFRVSAAANQVTFAPGAGAPAFVFDVLAAPDVAMKLASSLPDGATAARTQSRNWSIDVGADAARLSVNGVETPLDPHETVRSWALSGDDRALAVATKWSIRSIDPGGKQRWRTGMSSDTGLINTSADGSLIVAALSDGTIRWFRNDDGKEVLALFAHRNGRDWIAWIPSGYYMSSLSGDNYIGWHVNRGADHDPDFYRAVQFERLLYRPDIVQAHFRSRGRAATNASDAFDIARLDEIAPPRLHVAATAMAPKDGKRLTSIRIDAQSHSLPLQDWTLFVNGIPMTSAGERNLGAAEQRSFSREILLELPQRTNRLRVESSNGRALGIAEVDADAATVQTPPPGDLYVAAIGASQFADPGLLDLNFASRDAQEFARAFQSPALSQGFRSVEAFVLADATSRPASRGNIEGLAQFLAPARGEDTVIVFLASHGISDSQGNYFFVPPEGRLEDIEAVQRGQQQAPSLIRWDFFVDLLRRTAGRRVLIVDTCASGALNSRFDVHSLAKRSMSSSFALLAASKGDEKSQELPEQRQGLFTYALLQALRTGFDPDADGRVSLSEAFEFAFDEVQSRRNKGVGPQTPQLNAPEVLANMPLATVGKPQRQASAAPGYGLRPLAQSYRRRDNARATTPTTN